MADAIDGKGRLRETPLALVQFAFTGQQPLAERHLRPLKGRALGEAMILGDDHIANEIRVIEKDVIGAADAKLHDIAPPLRQPRQKSQRIAAKGEQNVPGEFSTWSGWTSARGKLCG